MSFCRIDSGRLIAVLVEPMIVPVKIFLEVILMIPMERIAVPVQSLVEMMVCAIRSGISSGMLVPSLVAERMSDDLAMLESQMRAFQHEKAFFRVSRIVEMIIDSDFCRIAVDECFHFRWNGHM